MTEVSKHCTDQFGAIAYDRHAGTQPGVVFLCGHGSDMNGNKAMHVKAWDKSYQTLAAVVMVRAVSKAIKLYRCRYRWVLIPALE